MKIRIKKNSIAVCMLTALMVMFSACSKYEMLINGSWEHVIEKDDGSYEYTGIIWTFDHGGTLLVGDKYGEKYYTYDIKKNSLIIHEGIDVVANFMILELNRTRMRLSGGGTMTFVKM